MSPRRGYIDALRGLAVLIMIEAHVLDSWTRFPDRQTRHYAYAMVLGGFGAPLFLFLLATGMRIGEALGLRQSDLHLTDGATCVTVQRSLVWAGAIASIVPPKTDAGRRTLMLPALGERAVAQLYRPADHNTPVFRGRHDGVPDLPNLGRALRVLCERAEVPRMTVHGLRAVHAALLAAEGVDLHSLRRRLGHARVSTTLDIYAYAVLPDALSAQAFDRATNLDGVSL